MGKKPQAQRRAAGPVSKARQVGEDVASSTDEANGQQVSPLTSGDSSCAAAVAHGNASPSEEGPPSNACVIVAKWLPEVERVAQSLYGGTPMPILFASCRTTSYIDGERLWDQPGFNETIFAVLQALPIGPSADNMMASFYRQALEFIITVFPIAKRCGGMSSLLDMGGNDSLCEELEEKLFHGMTPYIVREQGRSVEGLLWTAKGQFGNMFSHQQIIHLDVEDVAKFYHPSNSCWSCNATPSKLMRCTRCGKATYCSRECQVRNWKSHKKSCVDPSKDGMAGAMGEYAAAAKSMGLSF